MNRYLIEASRLLFLSFFFPHLPVQWEWKDFLNSFDFCGLVFTECLTVTLDRQWYFWFPPRANQVKAA